MSNIASIDEPHSHNGIQALASESPSTIARRHDLDALRAVAMLLGIVLHAALSFTFIPWSVQDLQQSTAYEVLFAFIHGFRMPLFFMLSGFFTAMLWRKRGLKSLAIHRTKRIFLPLVLGCFTIIPAMWAVSYLVSRPSTTGGNGSALFAAVVAGDTERVRSEIGNPDVAIDEHDPSSGSSPLCTAVFLGHTDIVEMLIAAGADVNLANRDKAAPIHIAVFMGRSKEAAMLLAAGADVQARDGSHNLARDLLNLDFGTTNFIASSLGCPVDETSLRSGRAEIAQQLGANEYLGSGAAAEQKANWEGLKGLLFYLPAFMHLWFLWFLCWLGVAFVLYTFLATAFRFHQIPRWLICSPLSLLWVIPLTMVPQSFMQNDTFGPDSSVGLLPIPSVLIYYAIFFYFGALYWDMDDREGRLGNEWYIYLPVALLVIFPLGLDWVSGTFGFLADSDGGRAPSWVGDLFQATFAWLMTFGLIGLFRKLLSRENPTLRYISDSSYWLYLAHLPLVILAQWLVRDLEIPAFLKFTSITIGTTAILMVTYIYGVRYTFVGHLLNGPRVRGGQPGQ